MTETNQFDPPKLRQLPNTMSKEKKLYRVTFIPLDTLSYDYDVEANDERDAYYKAKEQLQEGIGWDGAKDWEMSECKEYTDE